MALAEYSASLVVLARRCILDVCTTLGKVLIATLAVFMTAPRPVAIPHPSKHVVPRGASLLILATLTSWHTVYSEKVEVPICKAGRVRAWLQLFEM